MINDIKEVVYGFAEDQLQVGIDYLKDSENRKKLIEFGKMDEYRANIRAVSGIDLHDRSVEVFLYSEKIYETM